MDSSRRQITLSRRVFNEQEFKQCYVPKQSSKKPKSVAKRLKKHFCTNISNLTCKGILFSWFPILSWLPQYQVKENLLSDVAGGLTVAILHIPQGLAYAMLASLPAITGLYLAFVPLIAYTLLGTSRHLSMGTFAVVCLMVGTVCEREADLIMSKTTKTSTSSPLLTTTAPTTLSWNTTTIPAITNLITKVESNGSNPDKEEQLSAIKMEVAVALALLVGAFQFVMGLLRLGFVAVYLSDTLVSGFTTGAAILVFTSQIKHIFGLKVPRYSGFFATIKNYIYIFSHMDDVIPGAIVTGAICIVVLLILKKIDEKTRKHIKVPIPADLIVVVLGTTIAYVVEIDKQYDVAVLGYIPKGMPPLSMPKISLMPNIITDGFVIAVVIFATNISMAKMFAKRNNYKVDANQELIAYGGSNIIGSFFSCFPVSGSLSRSAVQESLGKTLLCNFPILIVILLVLLFIAPLFFYLPKAVLAAIIVVALKGLFLQFKRLWELWKICKYDAFVWISVWLAVVVLGIDTGLAVGVVVALMIVLVRSSRPRSGILGHVATTGIYRNVKMFPGAKEFPGIKIFRFESAVFYANAEYFRSELIKRIHLDPEEEHRIKVAESVRYRKAKESSTDSDPEEIKSESVVIENRNITMNGNVEKQKSSGESSTSEDERQSTGKFHTVIIDASTFSFIDTQGVNMLIQLALEFKKIGVKFYLASCRHGIREMLDKVGFRNKVGDQQMFISVHDAVIHALHPNDDVEEILSFDTELSTPPISSSPSVIIPNLEINPEESEKPEGNDTHF